MAYNYLSGEPITDLEEGRPLFFRSPDSRFDLANFMRTQLFASLATLRIGMDVLQKDEGVRLDRMFAHGGLFKTKGVAQRSSLPRSTPPSPSATSPPRAAPGESPSWPPTPPRATSGQDLADYLNSQVFANANLDTSSPDPSRRGRLRCLHPAVRRRAAGGASRRRPPLSGLTSERRCRAGLPNGSCQHRTQAPKRRTDLVLSQCRRATPEQRRPVADYKPVKPRGSASWSPPTVTTEFAQT